MARCRRRWEVAKQVVLYGNLTAAVIAYLRPVLGGVLAYPSIPNPRPSRFVQLTPSGGNDLSVVHDRALMMVDSWGSTLVEAQDLAQLVRAHLTAIRGDQVRDVLIHSAKPIGGVVFVPDPESDTPRYRQNFQFVTRGNVLG